MYISLSILESNLNATLLLYEFLHKINSDLKPITFIQKYKVIQVLIDLIHDTGRFLRLTLINIYNSAT